MAEIVHQTVTLMKVQRWRTYLCDVVRVAPAYPEVDQFITTTGFNLPDIIKGVEEKGWNQIDTQLTNGNPPISIPFNALEFFIAVSIAVKFYDTVGYRITVETYSKKLSLHSLRRSRTWTRERRIVLARN